MLALIDHFTEKVSYKLLVMIANTKIFEVAGERNREGKNPFSSLAKNIERARPNDVKSGGDSHDCYD